MKKVITLFILIVLPFKLCLASNEKQWCADPHPTYKRLRVEQADIKNPSSLLPNQWHTLPYEVFVTAFDYLSFKELARAQLVCKYWFIVAKDKTLSVENHYFKRSYATLWRKIDNNLKVQERVKEVIKNYAKRRNFLSIFNTIPDLFHKSLLEPSAIAKVVRTPKLLPPLFESNIKASHIYVALNQPLLSNLQQYAIESYIKVESIPTWNGAIFSEEFLNYTSLYRPYYKALYLLSLFKLPSGSPIYRLLDIINRRLSDAQAHMVQNEKYALCLPRAMLQLEIPPVECYKISSFCYKWAINNLDLTFKNLWERYEERFLSLAVSGNIPEAQFRLGFIAYNKGNYQNAESLLRQAANQGHAKSQYKLGLLLIEQGRIQEAEPFLYQAARQGHLFANLALGRLSFREGKLDEATSSFRTIAKQASGATLYKLAQLLPRNTYLRELDLFYRQIVSYTSFDQQHKLSILLLSNKNLKPIESFYRQILNHGKTDLQYLLADLLNKRGSTLLAKILLQEIEDQKGLGNLP